MNRVELSVAWCYIRSRRDEKFISVTAIFSFLSVALGVAALIIVTSVMNGFRSEFTSRVIGFNGHLTLYSSQPVINLQETIARIENLDEIDLAIPVIEKHALIATSDQIRGAVIIGIFPDDLKKYRLVAEGINRQDISNFASDEDIILGNSLMHKIGLSKGGEAVIITPEMNETGLGVFPRKKTFKIAASFKSGMHEYDSTVAMITFPMAQKLFKMKDNIGNILIFVKNPLEISKAKSAIHRNFPGSFMISDWKENNSSFMRAVEIERNVMFIILALITLVASFNVISCLIMLVKDKEKDIAVLKTLGMQSSSIMRIFFAIGSAIGVTGTILGATIGLTFSLHIESIRRFLEKFLSMNLFSEEVYFLTQLPSIVDYSDVFLIVLFSMLLCCLATLYPSKKAGKLNPVEILRYA